MCANQKKPFHTIIHKYSNNLPSPSPIIIVQKFHIEEGQKEEREREKWRKQRLNSVANAYNDIDISKLNKIAAENEENTDGDEDEK